MNAGVSGTPLAVLLALAILTVVHRRFADVRAVKTLAHRVGDVQNDRCKCQRSGFIGHKIRLRNRAGERRQHIIPMVIGVHVVKIRNLDLADVAVLIDKPAVLGRYLKGMRGFGFRLGFRDRFSSRGSCSRLLGSRNLFSKNVRRQHQACQNDCCGQSFFHLEPPIIRVLRPLSKSAKRIFPSLIISEGVENSSVFCPFRIRGGK